MTSSVLDELPGIGPARKRALLRHFGSTEAVLAASREQLQSVPGLPPKVGRELYGSAPPRRLGRHEIAARMSACDGTINSRWP